MRIGRRSVKAYNYTGPSLHLIAHYGRSARSLLAIGIGTPIMPSQPSKMLQTFANPAPARDFTIHMEVPEFTCLCPLTGQPDFAAFIIDYVPDALCVELKSLKLYMWSYRSEGAFHEAVTNRILDDLVAALKPRRCEVTGDFLVRGGIHTVVSARHP